jgi:hypothetical protein
MEVERNLERGQDGYDSDGESPSHSVAVKKDAMAVRYKVAGEEVITKVNIGHGHHKSSRTREVAEHRVRKILGIQFEPKIQDWGL